MALAAPALFPYTILLQTVPIVAIAPLIINWVGAGIFSVAIITFIICLAPIIANTTQGLISVDENLVHLFLMYNASPSQILFKLRLPNALPNLFTGIRIPAGISVIGGHYGRALSPAPRALARAASAMPSSMPATRWRPLTSSLWLSRPRRSASAFFFIVMFLEWLALHNWHESSLPQLSE
jgi:NitT/TauT family transport system permease protein